MNKLLIAACLVVLAFPALAQGTDNDAAYKQQVGAFIDEWHDDAAHSRQAFFDKMAPTGVYIGTDKTERWARDELKAWSKPYFARPSAWAFKSLKRNIAFSPDKNFIWWDEQLATQMGICQASGVMHRTAKGFEIEHFQLSIAVPNALADQFTAAIKKFEADPPAKK
jgi:SnoaL-like domain